MLMKRCSLLLRSFGKPSREDPQSVRLHFFERGCVQVIFNQFAIAPQRSTRFRPSASPGKLDPHVQSEIPVTGQRYRSRLKETGRKKHREIVRAGDKEREDIIPDTHTEKLIALTRGDCKHRLDFAQATSLMISQRDGAVKDAKHLHYKPTILKSSTAPVTVFLT